MNMDWILECYPEYECLVEFDNIESKSEQQEIHGLKERTNTVCMFCGKPVKDWKKKETAHAISECLGNKKLINYCECYECNHLFGEIAENHIGKFIMPYRIINEVYGKGTYKNVTRDMSEDEELSYGTYRIEQKKNEPIFSSETFDVHNMIIEKEGTGIVTLNKEGFKISIPRQKYNPKMVYVSLLKMAYTLLPMTELEHYRKNISLLYFFISKKPVYDENGKQIIESACESDREKYIDGLPNVGMEIKLSDPAIQNGVNVCLLKRTGKAEIAPQILFAIQMKWYTIVIPILSDDNTSENGKFKFVPSGNSTARVLDFNKIEDQFICDMAADIVEIPKELYKKLEEDLKNSNLMRK